MERTIAELGRQADDERVRLGALRTVLEVQGVLSSRQPAGEGKELRKGLEALIGAVKLKLSKGQKVRVRQATQIDIEDENEPAAEPENSPARAPKALKP